MTSCIYTITCIETGKMYVGYATDYHRRVRKHVSSFKIGNHENSYLQRAWNKYGEENFVFEILEECDKSFLCSLEHHWATLLNVHNKKYGYNIKPTHPEGKVGASKETLKKISDKLKGKKKSESYIMKRKGIKLEYLTFEGKSHTEETKNKIREANTGRVFSEEWRKNLSVSFKKKDFSYLRKPVLQFDLYDSFIQEHKSVVAANIHLGLKTNANGIYRYLTSKRKSAYGYKWKYK